MEPTYKQLDNETLEITVYTEKKFLIKKSELEANKITIEAADTAQIDEILTKFTAIKWKNYIVLN